MDSGWLRGCRCEVGAWGALCAWTTERLGSVGGKALPYKVGDLQRFGGRCSTSDAKEAASTTKAAIPIHPNHPAPPPPLSSFASSETAITSFSSLLLPCFAASSSMPPAACPRLTLVAPRSLSCPRCIFPTLADCTPRLFRGRIKGLQCRTLWIHAPPCQSTKGGLSPLHEPLHWRAQRDPKA